MSATKDKADRERMSRFARRAYRTDPARLSVKCADCQARVRKPCVGKEGQELALVHPVRAFDAGLTARFEHMVGIVARLSQDAAGPTPSRMAVNEVDGVVFYAQWGKVRAEVAAPCGHVFIKEDVWTGAHDDDLVEEYLVALRRLQEQECPHCRNADRNLLAAVTAASAGWPDLQGSHKQVPWANSIRIDKLPSVIEYMASVPFTDAWQVEITTRLVGVVEAHWWIDLRDADGWRVVQSLLRPTDLM